MIERSLHGAPVKKDADLDTAPMGIDERFGDRDERQPIAKHTQRPARATYLVKDQRGDVLTRANAQVEEARLVRAAGWPRTAVLRAERAAPRHRPAHGAQGGRHVLVRLAIEIALAPHRRRRRESR